MKIAPDCAGKCSICGNEICLAGNGDDEYVPATADQVIERLKTEQYSRYRGTMLWYLQSKGIEYKED